MAKECQLCGKTSHMFRKLNKLRGKYNPSPKFRRKPNLQLATVPVGNKKFKDLIGKKVLACTKCIKSFSKTQ